MGIMINASALAMFGAILSFILIAFVLICKMNKKSLTVVLLSIFAAVAIVLFSNLLTRPVQMGTSHLSAITHAAVVPTDKKIARQPAIWQDRLELNMKVDLYSSLDLACEGLVKDVLKDGVFSIETEQAALKVYTCSYNTAKSDISDSTVTMISDLLSDQLDKDKFEVLEISSSSAAMLKKDDPEAFLVEIELNGVVAEKAYGVEVRDGSLKAFVSRGRESGRSSFSNKFSDANWMNDMPGYSRALDSSVVFATGNSQQSCPDLETAKRQALEDAVYNLNKNLGFEDMVISISDVTENNIIQDVFSQQISGTESSIYRCKVLLAGESAVLRSMAVTEVQKRTIEAEEIIVSKKNNLMGMVSNLFVLLISVFCCYIICDYVTKGYYKGRIVVMLILVLVGGILVLSRM